MALQNAALSEATLTQHGYLVLADISGYTSYLAGVELDHAHEILTDLLTTIVTRFKTTLRIVKLEGDAVFGYVPEALMQRGETLLELLEATYTAFRDRRESAHRRTTCECNACRNIATLDLKFFVHHGDYVVQDVTGIKELVGSDVNLVHRLMKNGISQTTGWKAYALFTEEGLEHMGVRPEGFHAQTEAYEHLGQVQTHSLNLHERYRALTEARRVFVTPEAAHDCVEVDFAAPLPVIWEWFNEPRKRSQWMHSQVVPVTRVGGRNGPGARNHCVHGKNEVIVEDVLDVRPFEYFTVAHTPRGTPATVLITFYFTPVPNDGTHLQMTLRGQVKSMPDFVGRWLCKYALEFQLKPRWAFETIDVLIARSHENDVPPG